MTEFAKTMHNADNPLNLANLLDTGLRVAESHLSAPAVIPAATQNVNATPGAPAPKPTPQITEPTQREAIMKALPIIGLVVGALVVLALIIRGGK